jgi:hypothetical protein
MEPGQGNLMPSNARGVSDVSVTEPTATSFAPAEHLRESATGSVAGGDADATRRSAAAADEPAGAGPGAVSAVVCVCHPFDGTRSSVDTGSGPLSSRPGWHFRPFNEPDHPPAP